MVVIIVCKHLVLFRLHRKMHRALSVLPRNKKNEEGKQKHYYQGEHNNSEKPEKREKTKD
jgi:hypothetical protein